MGGGAVPRMGKTGGGGTVVTDRSRVHLEPTWGERLVKHPAGCVQ